MSCSSFIIVFPFAVLFVLVHSLDLQAVEHA